MSSPSRIAVDFNLSDQVVTLLRACETAKSFPDSLRTTVHQILAENDRIPFSTLYECHSWMKSNGLNPPPIWRLFRSSNILLPVPKTTPRNPELDERVNMLRTKFANQEYNKMIENLGPRIAVPLNKESGISLCSELRCMNKQLVMILNFIIIISAGFAFGYFIPEMIASNHEVNLTTRLVCALAVSLVVFFADLYFLLKNVDAVEEVP